MAAGRFTQLARDLEGQGAPAVVVELSQQAVREETQHIALCLDLVRAFGGRMESPPIPELKVEPRLAGHDRALLLQVVLTCCINETMSAAVLGEMLSCARPGLVHDTVQEILRDEINHGRIGWALLSHEASKGPLKDVEAMVPWMLKAAVTEELFSGSDAEDPDAEAASLGTLPRSSRLRLFHDSMLDLCFRDSRLSRWTSQHRDAGCRESPYDGPAPPDSHGTTCIADGDGGRLFGLPGPPKERTPARGHGSTGLRGLRPGGAG